MTLFVDPNQALTVHRGENYSFSENEGMPKRWLDSDIRPSHASESYDAEKSDREYLSHSIKKLYTRRHLCDMIA